MTTFAPPSVELLGWTTPLATNTGFARAVLSTQAAVGVGYNFPGAEDDYVEYSVALSAGTYKMECTAITFTAYAIADVQLDGVSIGTLDWYGAYTLNVEQSITGITVATTGVYTLKLLASSRHASSTGWNIPTATIAFSRTDDPSGEISGEPDMPHRIDIMPYAKAHYASEGTWALNTHANYLGGAAYENTSDAINDSITYMVAVPAGTWDLTVIGFEQDDKGITTVTLDGASLGTLDWYAGSGSRNEEKTITGFTVATAGIYPLKLDLLTKNASSSAYNLRLQHILLQRTGA